MFTTIRNRISSWLKDGEFAASRPTDNLTKYEEVWFPNNREGRRAALRYRKQQKRRAQARRA